MNKEIEDKVKELSRRIVGTGQIVVTADQFDGLGGGVLRSRFTNLDFAMNKEIEDKVKELSRRIVGTGQIVVTAESLTGGMISAALTSIPGASEWFERGFVTYTNQAKHEMLDVPQSILDRFSAVSTQTVSQMLEGAIRHSNATMAVAVSGIAGPDGAMPGRPVGTVFIGWKRKDEMAEVGRYEFKGDRQSVREQTVAVAIQGLIEMLDERQ